MPSQSTFRLFKSATKQKVQSAMGSLQRWRSSTNARAAETAAPNYCKFESRASTQAPETVREGSRERGDSVTFDYYGPVANMVSTNSALLLSPDSTLLSAMGPFACRNAARQNRTTSSRMPYRSTTYYNSSEFTPQFGCRNNSARVYRAATVHSQVAHLTVPRIRGGPYDVPAFPYEESLSKEATSAAGANRTVGGQGSVTKRAYGTSSSWTPGSLRGIDDDIPENEWEWSMY